MTGGSVTWVALLRGIVPTTHAKMSMRTLREACIAEGFGNVRTYVATENLLFDTRLGEPRIRATLGDILDRHGLDNPVFLRRHKDLERVVATDPFPDAAVERPTCW